MNNVTALMYHDVRDLDKTSFPNRYTQKTFMRVKDFENHIKYIKNHFEVISLEILLLIVKWKKILDWNTKNLAVLTFDDGLLDHHESVMNILVDNGLVGAFFIPVYPLVKKRMMNTHKVQFIIGECDLKQLSKEILAFFPVRKRNHVWDQYSKTQWKDNYWTMEQIFVTNVLRDYSDKVLRQKICDSLFEKYVTEWESELAHSFYLSPTKIEEMISKGMTVGGHGYTSENLLNFTPEEQEEEIKLTTDFLNTLGCDKLHFSYPHGGYNDHIIELMGKYNYLTAFITSNSIVTDIQKVNPLAIPRLDAPQKLQII